MNDSRIKQNCFTVFFMFAVTFVAISLVTIVQGVTRETVERNKTVFLKQAIYAACGMTTPLSVEALTTWYDEHVSVVEASESQPGHFRVSYDEGSEPETLVVRQSGPGLWGQVTALVGFPADGSKIKAVTFLEHNETPGLGARIDEPWFKRQFIGKSGPFRVLTPEPKNKNEPTADPQQFDQITGATVTSTAVRDILNRSLEQAQALAGKPTNTE
jgi:Na+-transporting NADH:ubiquinone oxidoreductase subunit C